MTQPQAPFGPRCAAWPACEEAGWVRRHGACQWCARAEWNAAPLREACQTVELPELVRGHERRIAALEDETRRLWRALAAAQKAQAL